MTVGEIGSCLTFLFIGIFSIYLYGIGLKDPSYTILLGSIGIIVVWIMVVTMSIIDKKKNRRSNEDEVQE